MTKRRLSIASSRSSFTHDDDIPMTLMPSAAAISIVEHLPPLPKLNGELMLQTFTHKSLHFDGSLIPETETNERLAELGDKVLQLAVTNLLYRRKPALSAIDIPGERDRILSDDNVIAWTKRYHLHDKLRIETSARGELDTPEEHRTLFNAYIGAVFDQSGLQVVTEWLRPLLGTESAEEKHVEDYLHESDDRPAKRIKEEPEIYAAPTLLSSATLPQASNTAIAQPVVQAPASNSSATSSTNNNYLPLFNQICNQRRLQVDWQAEFQGPPHAGRWNVRCFVNGIVKGQGQASSKQLGKEEAAKQAFNALGFALSV